MVKAFGRCGTQKQKKPFRLQPYERLMKNNNCAERKIDILVAK